MADGTSGIGEPGANDQYERYYTEKLWALLPEVYRSPGPDGEPPDALFSIVQSIAAQAAETRRTIDRLWENQSVETADDEVVPLLGELVGARALSVLDRRARRVDVARTIHYRKRRGTPEVLQALVRDLADWDAVLAEGFRRLARTRHGLDPKPEGTLGRFSKTPQGGVADLRSPLGASLAHGPFDEYSHTVDVRRLRGRDGRYGIRKLNLHLYSQKVYAVEGADPVRSERDGRGIFTFDPSGRRIPLFSPGERFPPCDRPEPWQVRGPIACRLLDDTRGATMLYRDALKVDGVVRDVRLAKRFFRGACLAHATPETAEPGTIAFLDPKHGLFALLDDTPGPARPTGLYHNAFAGDLGAGTYARTDVVADDAQAIAGGGAIPTLAPRGTAIVTDNRTYTLSASALPEAEDLTLVAADRTRPFVRLGDVGGGGGGGGIVFVPAAGAPRRLVLDGLWLASAANVPTDVRSDVVLGRASGAGAATFDWDEVIVRRATLDPGASEPRLRPVRLVVRGRIKRLVIERSIVGPIVVELAPLLADSGHVETLELRDSIVDATVQGGLDGAHVALTAMSGEVRAERVTFLGDVRAERLFASHVLVKGQVVVADNQNGCFRFSAASSGGRFPPRYESLPGHGLGESGAPGGRFEVEAAFFRSLRFGDPHYAQLSLLCPDAIARGGELGTEMGAFASLGRPRRMAGLATKVDEYAPAGVIAQFLLET